MLVSTGDIARVTGVSLGAVRLWESAGKIPVALRSLGEQRRWHVRVIVPVLMARGYDVPAEWRAAATEAA